MGWLLLSGSVARMEFTQADWDVYMQVSKALPVLGNAGDSVRREGPGRGPRARGLHLFSVQDPKDGLGGLGPGLWKRSSLWSLKLQAA